MNLRFPVVALAFLALSAPLVAHHSVPVNYDMSREITIEGALTEIVWINPHSRFGLDVTGDDGSTEAWLAEMGAHNTMVRAGFKTELFVIGDVVTVTGWPARRETNAMTLRSAVQPNSPRRTGFDDLVQGTRGHGCPPVSWGFGRHPPLQTVTSNNWTVHDSCKKLAKFSSLGTSF